MARDFVTNWFTYSEHNVGLHHQNSYIVINVPDSLHAATLRVTLLSVTGWDWYIDVQFATLSVRRQIISSSVRLRFLADKPVVRWGRRHVVDSRISCGHIESSINWSSRGCQDLNSSSFVASCGHHAAQTLDNNYPRLRPCYTTTSILITHSMYC